MMQPELADSAVRARLARELHDGIAQDLVGVGYSLDLLLANPETTVDARLQLRTLRFTVTELIDKVRKEIYYLRQQPTFSLAEGIRNAAQSLCGGVELNMELAEENYELGLELSYEVHRIAQEVLRNIASHAQASSVSIVLIKNGNILDLRICDDGIGGAEVSEDRYGMQGIRDRALAINAHVEVQSDSQGTSVWLRVPLEDHVRL